MADLNTVEEIYDFVANALAAAVDEPWKEIRLQAEVWKTSTGFTGDFTRDPAERGVADLDVDRLDYAVAKAIKKLQTIMASRFARAMESGNVSTDAGRRILRELQL